MTFCFLSIAHVDSDDSLPPDFAKMQVQMMYAEEVWVAATFRKAVQRFRHPSKAERRKVTIPELVILFTIKIVMCIHLILIDSEPPQWTSWSCRQ